MLQCALSRRNANAPAPLTGFKAQSCQTAPFQCWPIALAQTDFLILKESASLWRQIPDSPGFGVPVSPHEEFDPLLLSPFFDDAVHLTPIVFCLPNKIGETGKDFGFLTFFFHFHLSFFRRLILVLGIYLFYLVMINFLW